ncbi:MAG: helix-turn-helix domain-containing protein [Deltaproteobacteria bacterium]|nr:helix-turn-helix domain-containing protein [Deltaproteobacteria bacterium]
MPRRRFVYLYASDSARIMAAARRAAGLSQRAVANTLCVSRATVARLESVRAEMLPSEGKFIARWRLRLNVTEEELRNIVRT